MDNYKCNNNFRRSLDMFKLNTVGSDPEFFLFKGDEVFPAVNFTSGTKKVPEEIKPGFSLQRDNLLIEGNIPPCKTKDEFIDSITFLKDYIRSRVEVKNMRLVCQDSAKFKPRYLRIPEATEFGCDPYRLAWRGGNMALADDLSRISERVAGFHIHLGYEWKELPNNYSRILVAKAFDLFVTSPSREIHADPVRQRYYGRLGSYRDKPYGIECRSLGGYFLRDDQLTWVWDQLMKMEGYLEAISEHRNLAGLRNHRFTYTEEQHVQKTGLIPKPVYNYFGIKELEKAYVGI